MFTEVERGQVVGIYRSLMRMNVICGWCDILRSAKNQPHVSAPEPLDTPVAFRPRGILSLCVYVLFWRTVVRRCLVWF